MRKHFIPKFNSISSDQWRILADQFEEKGRSRVATILRLLADSPRKVLEIPEGISIDPSWPMYTSGPETIRRAKSLLSWYEKCYPGKLREFNRETAQAERGLAGDARAVLATKAGRNAVYAKVENNATGISAVANRKASKEAQRIARERLQRRADRAVAEAALRKTRGATLAKLNAKRAALQQKLERWAVGLGESYHQHVNRLYTSKRSYVVYGAGGSVEWDNEAYAKSYGYGAKYQLAGVRISNGNVVMESSRGTRKAIIAIPENWQDCEFDNLLDGDLWCVRISTEIADVVAWQRFGVVRGKVGCTGYLLQSCGRPFYGDTIADCLRELELKCEKVLIGVAE